MTITLFYFFYPDFIRAPPAPDFSKTFSDEELAQHDGSKGEDTKIYVAIKGAVFDVSSKRAMYGPGGGYHCFAGKDASKVKWDNQITCVTRRSKKNIM